MICIFECSMNLTQQRFLGYLRTPFLWQEELLGLQQFQSLNHEVNIKGKIPDSLRLGSYVERLVSYQLHQEKDIHILKENVQIIENKRTQGELDCLLLQKERSVHLEIAYKFYLYDESVGDSFLEHWIGPNRRDSMILKLNKIKEKQFPLLFSKECQTLLNELNLNANDIQQRTFFKAQLYIPYKQQVTFNLIDESCVCGYYVSNKNMIQFQNCKFYVPRKLDWIIQPHPQVDWMSFEKAIERIEEFHQKQSAPLCWVKQPNGEIIKLFVTWW